MRKLVALTFVLLLTIAVTFTHAAQPAQDSSLMKKDGKSAKAAAPKSDAEIQKCITDKFAASKSVKNGAATVANGEATLTGEARSNGAKGGATRSAQACGAQKVINNITVPEATKKGMDKKSEPAKK